MPIKNIKICEIIEENHSLIDCKRRCDNNKIKNSHKTKFFSLITFIFMFACEQKKMSQKISHHRNSNHVYSRDLSLIFIKNISTFSFLRHHQTKSTDIHAMMKGTHTKKAVEKVHKMMLM